LRLCNRHRFCVGKRSEKLRRDHVDALVGALRAQVAYNEKLQRSLEVELAMCIRVFFFQARENVERVTLQLRAFFPFAFAAASTPFCGWSFNTSFFVSHALRAIPTPLSMLSSSSSECASGPISMRTPRSLALRQNRQSKSIRCGSKLSSSAVPLSAAFSMRASTSTAYASRERRSLPVG